MEGFVLNSLCAAYLYIQSTQIHPYSSTCLKLEKAPIYMAAYCFIHLALGSLYKSQTGDLKP